MAEEIDGAQERNEEFSEGAAENHDGVAEPTEEEVAAFVDDQIDVIEDEESGAVGQGVEKEKGVEAEPGDSGEAGNGFPGVNFFFEESHWNKRSKLDSEGEEAEKYFTQSSQRTQRTQRREGKRGNATAPRPHLRWPRCRA